MSSFDWNKLAAGALLALIVIMLGSIIADQLVNPQKLAQNAYPIEVTTTDTAAPSEAKKEVEPISPLLATADAENGKKLAQVCTTCHSFEENGPHKVGPNLWNIVGAKSAHSDTYAFSDAMKKFNYHWDYENLNKFLVNPKELVPGTKMSYAGMKKAKDRADVIAYLRTLSSSPQPLP